MPENQLFEYAIIRVIPRVEREEFLNVGVVLFCKSKRFLKTRIQINEARILNLNPETDIAEIKCYLTALDEICQGLKTAGSIGQLPVDERFRWITATRSTVVQCSKVHPGLCENPELMLEKLFEEMVL